MLYILLSISFTLNTFGQIDRTKLVKEFLVSFETDDAFSRAVAFESFEKQVPTQDRPLVLTEIWQAAEKQRKQSLVPASILAYLVRKSATEMPWNSQLQTLIESAATRTELTLRRLSLNVLRQSGRPDVRPTIQRFLADPDEDIRDLALSAVSQWENSTTILQAYVESNQDKPEREQSVRKAQSLLAKVKFQQQKRP
jgi:hypothetical protein